MSQVALGDAAIEQFKTGIRGKVITPEDRYSAG